MKEIEEILKVLTESERKYVALIDTEGNVTNLDGVIIFKKDKKTWEEKVENQLTVNNYAIMELDDRVSFLEKTLVKKEEEMDKVRVTLEELNNRLLLVEILGEVDA